MKDLPHHLKKLNRRVIRSAHREEMAEEEYEITGIQQEQSPRQKKKQAKERIKKSKQVRSPHRDTIDERNQKMKHRVPIFDRNKAKPKTARPTKKKTPRI